MAYIRKIGKKWSYTVNLGIHADTCMRWRKTSSGFNTKKEAKMAAAKLEEEVNSGIYQVDTK
ncbi:Arm DNA-binding domain-containing protein [Gracilibacillus alcaliphilus]|uniref:Arm DNA-binding domain-containing protein n=1 Tax=Gracilibacillus alcaliphilus TaxID=1401441 RepID=UPI00195B11C9|nr:Arm DNA-binding domain-containing protein [Gracilibacillus alcaliphilus]MBM7678922.1 hypothetical protein [Gracilibacillus alcaliphilus]